MIDTLENVKTYLNIEGNSYDNYLNDFCEQIDALIKGYLNRDLEETEYTEYYDGSGSSLLILKQMPVSAVTTVEYWDGDSYEEVTSDDYDRLLIVPAENAVYLENYIFTTGFLNYRITYTAGYDASSMPADLKRAFRELLLLAYDDSPLKNRTLGKLSKTESAGSGSLVVNLDKQAQNRILESIWKYKRINVGKYYAGA